jgi:hypothetical protein
VVRIANLEDCPPLDALVNPGFVIEDADMTRKELVGIIYGLEVQN